MQIWLGKQYLGQSDHLKSDVRQFVSPLTMTTKELNAVLDEMRKAYPELVRKAETLDAQYDVLNEAQPKALVSASDSEPDGDES